eukprot:747642-Hanusia_phi.AAC.10
MERRIARGRQGGFFLAAGSLPLLRLLLLMSLAPPTPALLPPKDLRMSMRGGSESSTVATSQDSIPFEVSTEDDSEIKRTSSFLKQVYKHDPPDTETIGRFFWERPELEAQAYDEEVEAAGLADISVFNRERSDGTNVAERGGEMKRLPSID